MSRLDLASITKQLLGELEDITGRGVAAQARGVELLYKDIVASSPLITGWYKSNHRIVIRGAGGGFKTQGFRLTPSVKPTDAAPGSLDRSVETMDEEIRKLEVLALGDIVSIGTDIPYADEVEARHHVYAKAHALLGSVLKTEAN